MSDLDPGASPALPGKSTLTSRLSPAAVILRVTDPETARAFGEGLAGGDRARILRAATAGDGAARDHNGVAADAEAAVDRAAGTSGTGLPTHLQRRFEAATGADLSGVRVHTGGESAAAARAVGARAYTVGQDIHFGAGAYQPDDPFGMHLLAHEVAHTVQQAGGASRRQAKLEVSAPQDAAEVEADRAADAMVAGQLATIGSSSGVHRSPVSSVEASADGYGVKAGDKAASATSKSMTLSSGKFSGTVSWGDNGVTGTLQYLGKDTPLAEKAVQKDIVSLYKALSLALTGKVEAKWSPSGSLGFNGKYEQGKGGYIEITNGISGALSASGSLNIGPKLGVGNLASGFAGLTGAVEGTGTLGLAATGRINIGADGELSAGGVTLTGSADAELEFKPSVDVGTYSELSGAGKVNTIFTYKLKSTKIGKATLKATVTVDGSGNVGFTPSAEFQVDPQLIGGSEKMKGGLAGKVAAGVKAAKEAKQAEENQARDREEYNKEHNPAYQQSGGEVSPLDDMDSCELPGETSEP